MAIEVKRSKTTGKCYKVETGAASCLTVKPVFFSLAVSKEQDDFKVHMNTEQNVIDSIYSSI